MGLFLFKFVIIRSMKYFVLVLTFLFIPSGFSFAQLGSISTDIIDQGPSIELEPRYPSPNAEITASLNDYSLNGQVSSIDWYINGEKVKEALNQRSIEFKTGNAGTRTTIETIISIQGNGTQNIKRIIEPLYLDIIIEAQTRTPSFYKGRALPSVGSKVNFTALLDGGSVPANNLIYTWKINDSVIDNGGLRGQYKISAPTSSWGNDILSLTVSDLTGNIITYRDIEIPSADPEVLFYESNTLHGISQIPVKESLNLIGKSVTIQAEPYNLDILTYNRPPLLEWKIDSVRNPNNSGNPYEITLARQAGRGDSTIDFHVRNLTELLQGSKSSININY